MNNSRSTTGLCKIFLSCATQEFLPHREMLAKDLSLPRVKIHVQEDFIEGGQSTLEKLDEYIKDCAAVIHLIGSATGSKPASTEVTALLQKYPDFCHRIPSLKDVVEKGPSRLSYTQWEAWLAIYHNIPCYLYQADPATVRAPGFVEDLDQRALQEAHWNRFSERGKDRKTFRDEQQLCRLVLRSLSGILPSGHQTLNVIPKGLRSFDANDADFFLDLLPGARDKDGLPESIRFWKHAIEERDGEPFTVGIIYGPSGCGKSSLVKAALLPRLGGRVRSIYIEATSGDTEARLLNGLRERCPELPNDLDLIAAITALKGGTRLNSGDRVAIFIDQFEQWLHAKRSEQNTELANALRQCDGVHVQCVLLIRDDFFPAISRFMGELQIHMRQDHNLMFLDLFDPIHASNVLAAFGRGFGRIGEHPTPDQDAFLQKAIDGLAQDGRVISVRLALFAEMVKGRPWTPTTWKELGGMEGVGVTFLEEMLSSPLADARNRFHQRAIRSVLKALLPEQGSDIKGNMQSHGKLLEASGYARRPGDFDELLRILDGELRLITPTDPASADESSVREVSEKYYQLTHDYLVPLLRDWLTRKQKETRRGRAELLLADRVAVWFPKPESRHLPAWWEWLKIRLFTRKNHWSTQERNMMRKADTYHLLRGASLAVALACVIITGLAIRNQIDERSSADRGTRLVPRLLDAETAQVPGIIEEMSEYRRWTDPLLRQENEKAESNSRQKLRSSLALLPVDPNQKDYLFRYLLNATPSELPIIRNALIPHTDGFLDMLWTAVEKPDKGKESQRLRAASALALYDPESERWNKLGKPVANELVREPAVYLANWLESLRPVRKKLLIPLRDISRDETRGESERYLATDILSVYAGDQSQLLTNLLMDGDEKQFDTLFPRLKDLGEEGLALLSAEVAKKLPDEAKEALAKRQANAAVALLRMDRANEKVWTLLKDSSDPRARSYLIHRFSSLGANARSLANHLFEEPELTIRQALLLSLGEYEEKDFSLEERKLLVPRILDLYGSAADPGLHAATEWLLRTWGEEQWLKGVNEGWARDAELRKRRLNEIDQSLRKDREKTPPQWYVNCERQTMVVIPGPVRFSMGSPPNESKREAAETQHLKRIGRTFAIAATPVTKEQFLRYRPEFTHSEMRKYPEPSCPIGGVTWYEAAAYCNWLSKNDGIPPTQWCYEVNAEGQVTKMKEKYLSLAGYRLPTEAEAEFATRAGTSTSHYYGETEELLPKYAWYVKNSGERSQPVGTKKPNGLGLFDMHGNMWCMCQDIYKEYIKHPDGTATEDIEDALPINSKDSRVWRGGSFNSRGALVRSALRTDHIPTYWLNVIGFRVARTILAE